MRYIPALVSSFLSRLTARSRPFAVGFALTLLAAAPAPAADGDFVWARSMGGTNGAIGNSITVDDAGNVYTTGRFFGTADFDPGAGTANLSSAGIDDIFISKLDSAGNFLWARRMGGPGIDAGNSIAVDGAGNVYTTGHFHHTADFDPGAGTSELSSAGGLDVFVSKLDSDGNFVWARSMGGTTNDSGYSISVDGAGNVYTTGYFRGIADFDPGAGTANLSSVGSKDIFVSKLDSAGNFVWARSMGGAGDGESLSIAVDGAGNVYTTGYFQGTADFNPGAGTANLTAAGGNHDIDIFVSKLDSGGNFVWARRMGGQDFDAGLAIAVDDAGNVYTTGSFRDTADFDPGPGTANLTSAGEFDSFVSKLDSEGNFVWARGMGGTNWDGGRSIAVDSANNVYTTGSFRGTADFDPGTGTAYLTTAGGSSDIDIFVSKLDSGGNFVWARSMGGPGTDEGRSIAVDGAGNVYTTGRFQGTADFDPGPDTFNLTTAGQNSNTFVSKLSGPDPFIELPVASLGKLALAVTLLALAGAGALRRKQRRS